MEFTHNNISYTKVGTGPHLCFLHGFCENRSMWERLVSTLSSRYTCIAIDLPGFGKSAHQSFESLKDMAVNVQSLLQNENAQETILFGHSMGGYILAEYISLFGNQLNAAGFIHSSAASDTKEKKENRNKTIQFIEKHGTSEFFNIFIPSLVAEKNYDRLYSDLLTLVSETRLDAVLNGLAAMRDRDDHTETIQKFDKPILFLNGEKDNHYPKNSIYKQASACQLAQVECLKEIGHLSPLESPQECEKALLQFIQFVEDCKL